MSMIEAVKEYSGKDFTNVTDLEEARAIAKELNVTVELPLALAKLSTHALKNMLKIS